MKTIQLTVFFVLSSIILLGQVNNGGFEISNDSLNTTPKDWGLRKTEGFDYYLDNNVKYQGEKSFVIKSLPNVESQSYLTFSQIVSMDIPSLRRTRISAFIKTNSITGGGALWCQVWDINKKIIGFVTSNAQGNLNGTNDWKKCYMDLTLNSNCKYLVLGGYLQGQGTIWFDNFEIEDVIYPDIPPSTEVIKYTKKLIKIVKNNSLYTDSLDWNVIDSDLAYLSKGLTNMEEVEFISSYIIGKLKEAGDNHSHIFPKETSEKIEVENIDTRQPHGKIIENNIGYINIPGYESTNDTSMLNFASKIQNMIRTFESENEIQGWIIDLRENTGGNMYPMIAGLGPVLGDGTLGYFTFIKKKSIKWFYIKGRSGSGAKTGVKLKNPYVLKSNNPKIAVLIGKWTGSSGEMTAISFIGKPNTKLLGQPSINLTTGNEKYALPNGTSLLLSVANVTDRNRKPIKGSIIPDILVEDENLTLQTAIDWIKTK